MTQMKKFFRILMDNKAQIEAILKQRFFVTPTGYPPQNGFMDYGPPLAQIKLEILREFRRIFIDENTFEMEPSAMLPYEVLKNSGHIDKFCDVILTDGTTVVRADHYIEDILGEVFAIPTSLGANYAAVLEQVLALKREIIIEKNAGLMQRRNIEAASRTVASIPISADQSADTFSKEEAGRILAHFECEEKHLADLSKDEIDFVVVLYNLHSPEQKPFNPSKDFNLIFKLNERQFLRPEIAQSQFTSFRKVLELNNERLPLSTLAIGRSYRNEISARGGMLRTKEFEQAEIEYFSEDGRHAEFTTIRGARVALLPRSRAEVFQTTIGEAFDGQIITSEAICFFIAKAQEFMLSIGFRLDSLRFRQHKANEMAHYANDCWDVEVKTMSGWVECAGIADRSTFDLTCHSSDVSVNVKRLIPSKTVLEPVLNMKELGRALRSKAAELGRAAAGMTQEYICKNMKDNTISLEFEGATYEFPLKPRTVDCELFIPRVIEPSFGISRILYSLVEQSFIIRDGRNVLSLRPKMCYLHCMITYLKYSEDFGPLLTAMKRGMKSRQIRFKTNDRTCSIGKRYSSADEIGVAFFITLDFDTLSDASVTVRERDTMSQIRVKAAEVPVLLDDLISERVEWAALMERFGISNGQESAPQRC